MYVSSKPQTIFHLLAVAGYLSASQFLLFSPIFYIAPTKMSEPRPPVTKTDKQKVSLLRYRTCVSRGTYVILKKQKNRWSACFDYKLLENNLYRWCSCQNRKWHHEPSLDILGHTWLCILRSSIRCSRSSRNFCTSSCNFSCFSSNFIVSSSSVSASFLFLLRHFCAAILFFSLLTRLRSSSSSVNCNQRNTNIYPPIDSKDVLDV